MTSEGVLRIKSECFVEIIYLTQATEIADESVMNINLLIK